MNALMLVLSILGLANAAMTKSKIPKLGKNEFAVYTNNNYEIVRIKEFNKLELGESCFKNEKAEPKCEAYKVSRAKHNLPRSQTEYTSSPGSMYCKAMGGTSKVGISETGAESDFCFFKDGSSVRSWSAYFLHYPPTVIK